LFDELEDGQLPDVGLEGEQLADDGTKDERWVEG